MTNAPYLPKKDADFNNWFANFHTLLTATPTAFGLVSGDAVIVAAQWAIWDPAYVAATNPSTRTSVTVAAKDTARTNATAIIRPYATRIAGNPAVTDGNKAAIGVTIRSTTRTPVPAPTSFPTLSLRSITPGIAMLDYTDSSGTIGKAKAAGATGVEVWASFGTAPFPSPTASLLQGVFTKSPLRVDLAGHAGSIVTLFGRYVTRSGPAGQQQVGPWSSGLSFTVV